MGIFSVSLLLSAQFFFLDPVPGLTHSRWVEIGVFLSIGMMLVWLAVEARGAIAKAAEAEVRQRLLEPDLIRTLKSVPDATVIMDRDGRILSFNRAAIGQFGYAEEEVAGQFFGVLVKDFNQQEQEGYFHQHLHEIMLRGTEVDLVTTGCRKDNTTFPMKLVVDERWIGPRLYFVCFIRDLSEREETEKRLQELQLELIRLARLHEMGEMASTLAHELNQPLSIISNYSQGSLRLLRESSDETSAQLAEAQKEMAAQALRAGEIIRHLREFVMRGERQIAVEDIRKLVGQAASLALLGSHAAGVHASFRFDPSVKFVHADSIQIQQVLINLMRNAMEAMRASAKRELTVHVFPEWDFVAVEVSDTGPGLAEGISDLLFKPFVSTKAEGMGIGLSISKRIIEAHGGVMSVRKNAAGGAAFRFTLPAARNEP